MADNINLSHLTNVEGKRDSFGFTVRPQHLQRYREYGLIYKEEEDERVTKWKCFLEQCAGSAQSSVKEHCKISTAEAAKENSESSSVCSRRRNDYFATSSGANQAETNREVPVSKEEKRCRIKTYDSIRLSLSPIEQMMSIRVKKKVVMKRRREPSPLKHLPQNKEEISERSNYEENIDEDVSNKEMSGLTSKGNEPSDSCREEVGSGSCDEDVKLHKSKSREIPTINKDATKNQRAGDDVESYEPYFPWKLELESLVHGGVPKCLRGEVWQAFIGVRTRRVESYYQELLSFEMDAKDSSSHASSVDSTKENSVLPEKLKKQIEKDLPRTFPGHPALDEEGRNSLRRILTAYARHNPSVGYCQAMNFFAGLMLLLMPEENAFWALVGLIDDYFEGYYTQEMTESQVDQLVFEELMRERFPKLVNHLDYLGVEVAWLSGPWFLSIFVNMLPWESVLRVWDVILFEGNRVMLFRTALALMELYGPAIVTTKDAGDAVTLLQTLAGSTFDSSQLVLTACMGFLAITETRLNKLRNKHRPAVLGILDERARGTLVSKESKGLATKLYSFKHGPQSRVKGTYTGEGKKSEKSRADNIDYIAGINSDLETEAGPDLQDQVVWLKVEVCRLLEDKRQATLRSEELETAFMEMVKQDNRRQLSARVEQLEHQVVQLRQVVSDKQEQEQAMLQVLMRVEQEQRLTEDARVAAEQDAAVQRYTVKVLQEKYEKAMASLAEMDKRVKVAESMLEATLQYESGQAKASSPRFVRQDSSRGTGARKTGLLSFGLGWRDWNKGNTNSGDQKPEESQSVEKANQVAPQGSQNSVE